MKLLLAVLFAVPAFGDVLWQTNLTEYIGRQWTGEFVHYRLNAPLPADCRLVVADKAGKSRDVAVQVAGDGLSCVLDLPPYEALTLQLLKGKGEPDLPVARDGKSLTASSRALEIQVPDSIADGRALTEAQIPAPILRMRNCRQQEWGGKGWFTGVGQLVSLTTTVAAHGPVFTDIELDYRFAAGSYKVSLRLIRDQPLVLWRDEARHAGKLLWEFSAGRSLKAAYPAEIGKARTHAAVPIRNLISPYGTLLRPCYWVELRPEVDAGFTQPTVEQEMDRPVVLDEPSPKASRGWNIGFFTGLIRDWKVEEIANPDDNAWYSKFSYPVMHAETNGLVTLMFPLFGGKRALGFSVDDKPAQTGVYSIRYGQTSLDEVKDFVLDYDGDPPDSFPRLYFDERERRVLATNAAIRVQCPPLPEAPPLSRELPSAPNRESVIPAAMASTNDELRAFFQLHAETVSRGWANHFFYETTWDRASGTHGWFCTDPGINILDATSRYLTPAQYRRVRARALLLAYKLAGDMFKDLRESHSPMANMRVMAFGWLGRLALLYPQHPMANEWRKMVDEQFDYELTHWRGADGAWVEAPHYMGVSMDFIIAYALAKARAGDSSLLFDDRLKQTMLWLAKICPPRDARYGNRRHYPEIGNTYRNEASFLFSAMARAYRQRDPAFADAMQWMWCEMGRPLWSGIGGGFATTDDLREFLRDPAPCPATPPAWKSERFTDSGAVLRAHFATDRETYLYLIQGNLHEHYDKDNGSILLWGKGRPLCEDWGYTSGPGAPASEHNRMDIGGEGQVTEFAALERVDYLHSRQGPWDRQILFVKDARPLGPNYFVIRDSTAISGTNTWPSGITPHKLWPTSPYVVGTGTNDWRLWLNIATNSQLAVGGRLVTARGRDDVDLDIWFDDASLRLLQKIRQPVEAKASQPEFTQLAPDVEQLDKEAVAEQPWVYAAEKKTLWVMAGNNRGYWGSTGLEQRGITLRVPRGQNVVTLLYPRLRDEKRPEVQSFANDRALKIVSAEGTDIVFLSLTPMEVEADGIRFKGTAGAVQRRATEQVFSLGAGGEIAGKEFGLSAPAAASLRAGKEVLTVELAPDFPGGQIVVTAPAGYTATGITLERQEGGRYVCFVPAGHAGFSMRRSPR